MRDACNRSHRQPSWSVTGRHPHLGSEFAQALSSDDFRAALRSSASDRRRSLSRIRCRRSIRSVCRSAWRWQRHSHHCSRNRAVARDGPKHAEPISRSSRGSNITTRRTHKRGSGLDGHTVQPIEGVRRAGHANARPEQDPTYISWRTRNSRRRADLRKHVGAVVVLVSNPWPCTVEYAVSHFGP
jgi:hypothetical protein